MGEVDQLRAKYSLNSLQNEDDIYLLEEMSSASEEKRQQYRKKLGQYFLYGKKTDGGQSISTFMSWFRFLAGNVTVEIDFPILQIHENQKFISLDRHLAENFLEVFDLDEAATLAKCRPKILSLVQDNLSQENISLDYRFQIKEAFKVFRQSKVDDEDPDLFRKHCDQFESQLLRTAGTLIPFSGLTAFHILNLQLHQRSIFNQAFLKLLTKTISGLEEILMLQNEEANDSSVQYDFAEDLLSFDKIAEISTPKVSSVLPEERLHRLKQCHHVLTQGQKSYADSCSTIFTTKELVKKFNLQNIIKETKLIVSENPCGIARKQFNREIQDFVQVIAALRLSDLEIDQKYDPGLHASYFDGFDQSHLSDEDLRYFHSLIVVEESTQLTREPKDFMTILAEDALVKVLAVNSLKSLHDTNEKDDVGVSYLELPAMAIFRRNAYAFQGGTDDPALLNKAIQKGLEATSPVLWNVLSTRAEIEESKAELLKLKIAIESRYFPRLEYDKEAGDDFGSHFDLTANSTPEADFPAVVRTVKSKRHGDTLSHSLTIADFLATDPANLDLLEILPSWFESEDLIPLGQYFSESYESRNGKIPFIRIVNENNILTRAAIPLSWLALCRSRLEYWRFLQELAGVKSAQIRRAVEKEKSVWETIKKSDLETLKKQLQDSFEKTRANDLEKAIKRMLNALLDPNLEINQLDLHPNQQSDDAQEEVKISPQLKQKAEEIPLQEKAPIIKNEVWIESDLCTSCNDCTDALPGVFRYNDDKRAIVHNPTGGSYAKIVAAAEKCPAKCIHPGLPHDKNETGLDKLLKRAEKYN